MHRKAPIFNNCGLKNPMKINSMEEITFEMVLKEIIPVIDGISKDNCQDQKSLFLNLKGCEFIDPYGMVGILEIGKYINGKGRKVVLSLPESDDVLKYLERMDFFEYAGQYFVLDPPAPSLSDRYLRSRSSDVLLEIKRIEDADDIHAIVDRVMERAETILATHLNYDKKTIDGFVVALSEVCQNIIEHSESTGFVGIQKYFFEKRLNKNVVKIAVMDTGIGFKSSLRERFSDEYGDRWTDLLALEKALIQGASRYRDVGRGHGLAAVKRFVERWQGRLSIRSGSAKLSILPSWERFRRPRQTNLPFFPGAQIGIILPAV